MVKNQITDWFHTLGERLCLFGKAITWALAKKHIEGLLNERLERYGKMTELKIDSKQKTIELEILLKGEDKPIQVKIGSYEIVEGGLDWSNVETSREWITEAIEVFKNKVPNPVPVDPKTLTLLKLFM